MAKPPDVPHRRSATPVTLNLVGQSRTCRAVTRCPPRRQMPLASDRSQHVYLRHARAKRAHVPEGHKKKVYSSRPAKPVLGVVPSPPRNLRHARAKRAQVPEGHKKKAYSPRRRRRLGETGCAAPSYEKAPMGAFSYD
jgi:hypothetical protein